MEELQAEEVYGEHPICRMPIHGPRFGSTTLASLSPGGALRHQLGAGKMGGPAVTISFCGSNRLPVII